MKKMVKTMVRVLLLLLLQVSVSGLFVQKAEATTVRPEPTNTCTIGKDGAYTTTVSDIMGKTFSALDYQYERVIRYHISIKEKTQIKLEVTRGDSEHILYNEDIFIITKAKPHASYYRFTDSNGERVDRWKVSPGTTDSVTITLQEGDYWIIQERNTYRTDFTVKISEGPVYANKITFNIKKITLQPEEQYVTLRHYTEPDEGTARVTYKSDNPKIAKVNKKTGDITAVKEGKTKIRACLPNGAEAVCTVTVKEKTALAKVESQVGFTCYHNKNYVVVNNDTDKIYMSNEYTHYRVYRSTKKNGKYKLVKKGKTKAGLSLSFTDTKVKSNTKYYYKASVKTPGRKKFGPLSKPVAYWTAPSPDVTFTSNGNVVAWNKSKQATGYTVREVWGIDVGYNIFGQKLHDSHVKASMTTQTQYIKERPDLNSTVFVKAYAKHGKYYYVSGEDVTSKKNDFIFHDVKRYAR